MRAGGGGGGGGEWKGEGRGADGRIVVGDRFVGQKNPSKVKERGNVARNKQRSVQLTNSIHPTQPIPIESGNKRRPSAHFKSNSIKH